ncbi:hypothetical protein [Haloferax sp. DFSO60]|uniref:hypothetical protein n=1 Tax=Haloferax sp. DFSO60 TaxID=3388652 RepID=UPI0039789814
MRSGYTRRAVVYTVGISLVAGCTGDSEGNSTTQQPPESTSLATTTESESSWYLSAEVDPELPSDVEPIAYPQPQQENEQVTGVLDEAKSSATRGEWGARIWIQRSQAEKVRTALEPYTPENYWTAVVESDGFVFQMVVGSEE